MRLLYRLLNTHYIIVLYKVVLNMKIQSKIVNLSWALIIFLFLPSLVLSKYDSNQQLVEVDIVQDNGNILPVYPINSQYLKNEYRAYLQALKDENYSLRIQNHSNQRIGLVIAVDGRNIISGKKSHLKHKERMYILGPYETQSYSGWRTSSNDIHRFYFTNADTSYAQAFGDDSAMGVIAMAVFKENRPVHQEYKLNSSKKPSAEKNRSHSSHTPSQEAESDAQGDAGTGFGAHQNSYARSVHFNPERSPEIKYFYKYEWKEVLCKKQIIECRQPNNRFWPKQRYELGFAPHPVK